MISLITLLALSQTTVVARPGRNLVDGGVAWPVYLDGAGVPLVGPAYVNALIDGGFVTVQIVQPIPAGTNNIGDVDVASLPSVTIGTFPDNEPFNVAQYGGVAVGAGNAVHVQSGTGATFTAGTVSSANNDGACVSVTSSTTVLASNASRRAATVTARASNTDTVYVKLGATATSSDFPLEPGQSFDLSAGRVYTGVVDGIAASGTQSVCVVELN